MGNVGLGESGQVVIDIPHEGKAIEGTFKTFQIGTVLPRQFG